MATLTIEKFKSGTIANLKTFNFLDTDNLMLAISNNGLEVLKQEVKLKNNTFSFEIDKPIDINNKIGCVLIKRENGAIIPLLWGSENVNTQASILKALNNDEIKAQDNKSTYKEKNEKQKINLENLFEESSDNELNVLIDKSIGEPKDEDFFNKEENNLKDKLKPNGLFFDLISEQIEDLFNKFPSEVNLEQLIPNSKWVKVDYENDGNYYVLGLIYDDVNIKYIAYGVPGNYSSTPPKELEAYSQWLPIDPENPLSGGYWVMYQDALSGDNIKVDTI
jgi:hypothetical protein